MDATPALVEMVADGGHAVGFGHLGRCLAIAAMLGDRAAFTLTDPGAVAFVRARGGGIDGAGGCSARRPSGSPRSPARRSWCAASATRCWRPASVGVPAITEAA